MPVCVCVRACVRVYARARARVYVCAYCCSFTSGSRSFIAETRIGAPPPSLPFIYSHTVSRTHPPENDSLTPPRRSINQQLLGINQQFVHVCAPTRTLGVRNQGFRAVRHAQLARAAAGGGRRKILAAAGGGGPDFSGRRRRPPGF